MYKRQVYQEHQAACWILQQLLLLLDDEPLLGPTRITQHYYRSFVPATTATAALVISPHRIVAAKPESLVWNPASQSYSLNPSLTKVTSLEDPLLFRKDVDPDWQYWTIRRAMAVERHERQRVKWERARRSLSKVEHHLSLEKELNDASLQQMGCGGVSPKCLAALSERLTFVKGTAAQQYQDWKLVLTSNYYLTTTTTSTLVEQSLIPLGTDDDTTSSMVALDGTPLSSSSLSGPCGLSGYYSGV